MNRILTEIGASLIVLFAMAVPCLAQGHHADSPVTPYFRTVGEGHIVYFRVVGDVPNIDVRITEMVRCLNNMPPQHHQYLPRNVLIVPGFPGGRQNGGGYFPSSGEGATISSWLDSKPSTGIDNSLIEAILESGDNGLIAISNSRMRTTAQEPELINHLTILHEASHAIQAAGLSLVPSGTSTDDLAQVYARANTVKEHSAEAYSRYIASPSFICRANRMADGESRAQCASRVRGLLKDSPAFRAVPADWRPLGSCRTNSTLDGFGEPAASTSKQVGPGVSAGVRAPIGKGLFYQAVSRAPSKRIDVGALGSAGISWIAIPIKTTFGVREAIHEMYRGYTDDFRALSGSRQVFVWRGEPEKPTTAQMARDQANDLINAAVALGADGVIIDPEEFWLGRGDDPTPPNLAARRAMAEEIMSTLVAARSQHGLSIGLTSIPSFVRGGTFVSFDDVDFYLPQFYNRLQSPSYSHHRTYMPDWEASGKPVVPLSGAYKRSGSGWSSKSASEVRDLTNDTLAAMTHPAEAFAWWTNNWVKVGGLLPEISSVPLGGSSVGTGIEKDGISSRSDEKNMSDGSCYSTTRSLARPRVSSVDFDNRGAVFHFTARISINDAGECIWEPGKVPVSMFGILAGSSMNDSEDFSTEFLLLDAAFRNDSYIDSIREPYQRMAREARSAYQQDQPSIEADFPDFVSAADKQRIVDRFRQLPAGQTLVMRLPNTNGDLYGPTLVWARANPSGRSMRVNFQFWRYLGETDEFHESRGDINDFEMRAVMEAGREANAWMRDKVEGEQQSIRLAADGWTELNRERLRRMAEVAGRWNPFMIYQGRIINDR